MPSQKIGQKRKRLAKLLQANFPEANFGIKLTWEPELIYPATGFYRSSPYADCARWEAFALHYREDGTSYTAFSVHGYRTITEIIQYKKLRFYPETGEVGPDLTDIP